MDVIRTSREDQSISLISRADANSSSIDLPPPPPKKTLFTESVSDGNEVYQLLLGWRDGGWRGGYARLDQTPPHPQPLLARDYSLGCYPFTL